MKRISGILAVMAAIVMLSACGRKVKPFDYGSFEGTKYTNSFFGFSLRLPEDWYVLDREEIQATHEMGIASIPNEGLRKEILKAENIDDATLVSSYNYRPGTQPVGFNSNFQLIAENTLKYTNFRSGAEYLVQIMEKMKVSGMNYTGLDNPLGSVEIGGVRFDHGTVRLNYQGFDITQDYYSALREGFMLSLIVSYVGEQPQAIRDILGSVAFE